jgi:hypothetical protein
VFSSVDAACQRSPSVSADTADFNPWPLSSPAESLVGSESSRRAPFSPPRELGEYYVASYATPPRAGSGYQGNDIHQIQSAALSADTQNGSGSNRDQDAHSQMQALAPAFKAPRAP